MEIKHIGSTVLKTLSHSLQLSKVLHVPHLAEDLLSVKQLCKDNQCWFICDDIMFFVQDKVTKEILYRGRSKPNELFQIPMFKQFQIPMQSANSSAFLVQLIKSAVWHKRLGHPTNDVLSVMLNKSQLSSIVDKQCSICSDCINGKMSRLPFPTESTRCLVPFEKIHTDI